MLIGGGIAAAVADDDIVAAHIIVTGNDNRTALGSIDGGVPVNAADINAAVVGGRAGDARIAAAHGRSDTLAGGHRPDIAAVGFLGIALLGGKLAAQADDLLLGPLFFRLDLVKGCLVLLFVFHDLLDQIVRFCALGTQRGILLGKGFLRRLLLGKRDFQLCLLLTDLLLE